MNQNNPKVSVIVPIYNVEKYIHKCIDSILSQIFTDFECILVDDCSPDTCPEICDSYADKDNRIKVIHKKKNVGLPQGRKSGVECSIGDYIIFIDGDDWIEPDMLKKMYSKAIDTDCDIIISDMFTNIKNIQIKDELPEIYDKKLILKHILLYGRFGTSVCNKLIKRQIYSKVNFPNHNYIEDRVITIQTIFFSRNIGYISDAFYHYNKNEESICSSSSQDKKTFDEYNNLLIIESFLLNNNIFSDVENEFSYRSNLTKASFLKSKELRKYSNDIFSNLYPKSIENINNIYKLGIFNKFILINRNKSIIYMIIDIYNFIQNIEKRLYRLIIPKKLRYSIWKKCNSIC